MKTRGEMKMFSNKELRSMIITLFFEQLLVMLVGIVDTFVVSSCGEAAVSGVSLVNLFIYSTCFRRSNRCQSIYW